MVFSSPVFLFLFLPLVLLATAMAGGLRARNTVLTVASLLFYAWGELGYVLVMLASILLNHLFARWLEGTRGLPAQRNVLVLTVLANVGLLVFFKYANFLVDNVNLVLGPMGIAPIELAPVHLPIGISFFTFQGLSYAIDVYRGHTKAHRGPGDVALYIALFPQLIAGPIVRHADVAAQIEERTVTVALFASGARRFIQGLAKKLLLADTLARVSTTVLAIPHGHMDAASAWLGMTAFSLQLYFDFSGYSDMAIGLGRMFGFTFLENFNFPYIARSIREFWTRWHISLSTWFRDYVYVPLGGNRDGAVRTYRNLFIVFLLTGLWHGASWNFVVWGMYHGLFMVLERLGLGRVLERLPRPLSTAYALVVVVIGWAFFQAPDVTRAWHIVLAMLGMGPAPDPYFDVWATMSTDVWVVFAAAVLFATPLPGMAFHWFRSRWVERAAPLLRAGWALADGAALLGLLLLCAMHMAANTYTPFLYFRF